MELNTEILTTNFNKHHKTHFHTPQFFSETQPLARETPFNIRSSAFRGTRVHTPTSPHRSVHYGITRVLAHLLPCLISPGPTLANAQVQAQGQQDSRTKRIPATFPPSRAPGHAWLPGTWPRGPTASLAQAPPQPRHKGS